MKQQTGTLILLMAAALFLAGCYEAPLSTEHTIPIDPALPGLWEAVPKPGSSSESDRMMLLRYSDTEYFIHHPCNDGGMYFRAYPVNVGGVSCMQIKLIGTKGGSLSSEIAKTYYVASFTLTNGIMEIRLLNPKVVSTDLKTSEKLRQAIRENRNHQELFEDPIRFRRCKREKDK